MVFEPANGSPPATHDVFGGPSRASRQDARGPKSHHREAIVRRDRLPSGRQHVRRHPRRRSHRTGRAGHDRRDVEGTGREAVRSFRAPRHGGLAPRGARGIPHRRRAPNLGGTRGRIRLFVAEETTLPEAVTRASVLWTSRGYGILDWDVVCPYILKYDVWYMTNTCWRPY